MCIDGTEPISEMNLGDVEAIVAASFPYHAIGRDRLRRTILDGDGFDPELAFLARVGGRPAGFLAARHRAGSPSATLTLFATAPEYRQRSIAATLHERVENAVRARGAHEILIRPTPALPGLDLRYHAAVTMLLRREYAPDRVLYSQVLGVDELDTDTVSRESDLASGGVTVRKLLPEDAAAAARVPGLEPAVPADRLSEANPESFGVHAAFAGDRIIAFAASEDDRFGPMATEESFRRRGIGSVLFLRACADIAARGYREVLIGQANILYYARAFGARIASAVWHMRRAFQE
jgi:GNAT superfamily N-acetyltransferase